MFEDENIMIGNKIEELFWLIMHQLSLVFCTMPIIIIFYFNMSLQNVVIVGAKRTPVGTFMGGLKDLSAPTLGKVAAMGALSACQVDPKEIEEVYMGCVLQGGVG